MSLLAKLLPADNILLDLEAGMRLVPDPAAGSYYFENLTEAIAQAAWDHFLNQKKRS